MSGPDEGTQVILLPSAFIALWLLGLLAFGLFLLGGALVWYAVRQPRVRHSEKERKDRIGKVSEEGRDYAHEVHVQRRRNPRRWALILGLALLAWTFAGSFVLGLAFPSGDGGPRKSHSNGGQRITRPDATELQVESFGEPNAPTLVLTHGWSLNRDEWDYLKQELGGRFRFVTWDLRGLGQSRAPSNNDYALERMAEDLDAVVQTAAGSGPVVLVGHSIGGMVNLTYCKLFPQRLGHPVAGIVQLNTTYTDPAKTTKNAQSQTRLQNTIGEQLLHTTAALSPVLRIMNWFAYRSGLLQVYIASSSFAGTETRSQVNYAAGSYAKSSPEVVALGTLGMLHWDASDVLARINIPVLIVTADQDTTTIPAASEHMKQRIPNSELAMMHPGAHLGVLERHAEYNRAIGEFAAAAQKESAR
jgi:pimeloyl-ACP methyl ester carboxylesterase